tara:strand:- start:2159 stop:4897 length:2739 start_codon:yes stop_codon:yes gene_type:complete
MANNNVRTITDIKNAEKNNNNNLRVVDNAEAITPYPFKKDKEFTRALRFWEAVREANSEVGSIIAVPIDKATKRPMGYVKFAVKHATTQRWSQPKLRRWITKKQYHQEDCDIGVLFGGSIGVLDFDCEKDYKWFIQTFEIDEEKYLIVQNRGKHNCSCETAEEYTYHFYFQMDDFWDSKKTSCPCIYSENGEDLMNIDFLRDSPEGTPHVAKCYAHGSNRKVLFCPPDKVIQPLSVVVSHYFKGKWKKSKREIIKGDRNAKFIDLVESIDKDIITGKDMEYITRELLGVGIDPEIIINLSVDIRNGSKYDGRIGDGPSKRYTDEEHLRWIQNIIDSNVPDGQRRTATINQLARKNIGTFTTITAKWLEQFGTQFCVSYLHDLKCNIQDEQERGRKVKEYYNHFFIQTSGMKKNGIWFRKFDNDGFIVEIGQFQDKSSFVDYCGVEMICYPNGKAVNTASWWFKEKSITYSNVIFQPFGLKRSEKITIPPNVFNTFTGYKMKFVPDYHKPDFNHMGNLINDHIRKVICWNGKGKDEVNEELYLTWMAWMYKLIVKGERTHVAMVNYSKGMGSGKSLVSSGLMTHVLGEHVCMLNSSFNKMIKDAFTDYWDTNVLTTLEEMPQQSNDKDIQAGWDFIKALITEDKMTSRKFMTAPDKMDLHVNLIINTNHFYSIHPSIPVRRAQVNRVSPHYIGDNAYFTPLVRAIDSYEGWENFIHEHLIKKYPKFSHIAVIPNESFMIETQYRKELLARGNKAIVYFFKEFMDAIAKDCDEPFAHVMGKHLTLQNLFERYEGYKAYNRIEFCSCKNLAEFEKKIMSEFEITIKPLNVKSKYKQPVQEGLASGTSPNVIKTRMGKAIVIDEQFIKQVNDVVKHKALNDDDALLMTEDEQKDLELDLDELMPYETKDNQFSFLD